MSELFVKHLSDLPAVAEALWQYAGKRRKWMLCGEMGVGKTALVRAICAWLQTDDEASSPTYSLVNAYVYTDQDGEYRLMHHLDLYRLNDLDEALDMGIETYLDDDNLCIIEWPELIEPIWPDDALVIRLSLTEDGRRKVAFV